MVIVKTLIRMLKITCRGAKKINKNCKIIIKIGVKTI